MADRMTDYIGTPYFVSPEILNKEPYDSKCDIWSLGICLYKLITNEYPFKGKNFDELIKSIRK